MVEILYVLIVVTVTCLYKFVKIHRAIHIKRVILLFLNYTSINLKNLLKGQVKIISLTKVGTLEHVGFFLL